MSNGKSIKVLLLLTFDVKLHQVGHPAAHSVGGLAGILACVGGGEALQHQASVSHYNSFSYILLQLHALKQKIVLLDNCRIMHRISYSDSSYLIF